MTLDEAIKHCEEIVIDQDKLSKRCDDASGYSRSHNESIRTNEAKKYEKCSQDFRQLAGWLRELKALKAEPCDDAISREDAMFMILHYGNEIRHEVMDDIKASMIKLPSVTPVQKTGKWKLVQRGKSIDICCDNCGAVRVEEIAYNYTIDELNKFFKEDFKEYLKRPDMSYCPCCGTEMEMVDGN